jgi:hypothetical protein
VTLGRKDDALARVLLDAGAKPRTRATLQQAASGHGRSGKGADARVPRRHARRIRPSV